MKPINLVIEEVIFFWVLDELLIDYYLKNLTNDTDASVQGQRREHARVLEKQVYARTLSQAWKTFLFQAAVE